jgi:YbbR domain-containing protein
MSFDRILRILTANIGAKIISVLFAVILWGHVTFQQEDRQVFRVPLVLANIPDSLTIIHRVPEFVEVAIRGSRGDLLKLRFIGRLRASVDLSTAGKGRETKRLTSSDLNLPDGIDPRNVSFDNPKTLSLNFERVVAKSVPVKLVYKGEIPRDLVIVGTPAVIPDKVTIRGAASIVSGIGFINTEEIGVKNKKGRFTQEIGLDLGGRDITADPRNVLIDMEISKKAVRTLANIPPTLLQDDETILVDYSPKVVTLTVEGPEEIVRNLKLDDISVILDITAKEPGFYRVQPNIIVPAGIDKYWLDIEAFEIAIRAPGSEEDAGDEE